MTNDIRSDTSSSTSTDTGNDASANTAELAAAVTGVHTTNGLPHSSTSITPHIVVSPAAAALDFYRDVFGARIVDVTRFPDGSDLVAHAVLDFGSGMLTLSDPIEGYGLAAPASGQPVTYSLSLYRPNVDEVTDAAIAAGATLREPVMTFVTGDRYASITDPFGLRWSIMTRVEDLSDDESAARVAEWAKSQSGE